MVRDESVVRSSPAHLAGVRALMYAMRADGFHIERAEAEGFETPQRVISKRPDVIGVHPGDGLYAFGEAKTGDGDLDTEHARTQLHEFSSRKMSSTGAQCPFYLAVPQRCVAQAKRLLGQLGLLHMRHIKVVPFKFTP
jgi:hypothetical protein